MNDIDILRTMVRGVYDLQKLRTATGLRLIAIFRSRIRPEGSTEVIADDDMDEEAIKMIDVLRKSYRTLVDGVARNRRLPAEKGFTGDSIISSYTELVLVDQFLTLQAHEDAQFRQFEVVLKRIPIYNEYLRDVVGVGPAMAAVLITYLDPAKARYASSFWRYAGLDLGSDGRGRSRRQEHLVEREYTDKNGKLATRMGVTYNPFLKTKLMGVLGGSFLRTGSPWRKVYDSYKHRIVTDDRRVKVTVDEYKKANARGEDTTMMWTPGRINTAATRYMVKMFLAEFWAKWRTLEDLPVTATYHEGMQGHVHGADHGRTHRPAVDHRDDLHA